MPKGSHGARGEGGACWGRGRDLALLAVGAGDGVGRDGKIDNLRHMRRKRLVQMAQEMDREYGAAQLMILYQLPRFSAQGGPPQGAEAETLRRVLGRIVAWGVSHDAWRSALPITRSGSLPATSTAMSC